VVTGVVALVWPGLTILVLSILLGVNALLYGIFSIAQAMLGDVGGRSWSASSCGRPTPRCWPRCST